MLLTITEGLYTLQACSQSPEHKELLIAAGLMLVTWKNIGVDGTAGLFLDAKKIVWGDWSVESQYVTLGQAAATAPAAAAAAAPAAGFGKKRNKKGADKGTEKKMSTAAAQQAAADEQHAIQQLQVCCWDATAVTMFVLVLCLMMCVFIPPCHLHVSVGKTCSLSAT